jgi:hypothetical protein
MTGLSNIAALRAMFPLLPSACMRGPGLEPRLRCGVWLAILGTAITVVLLQRDLGASATAAPRLSIAAPGRLAVGCAGLVAGWGWTTPQGGR